MTSTLVTEKDRVLQRQPRIICVGTGRDGTLSVYQMIKDIFDRTDGRRAMHEYRAREFYNAFADFKETGNERFADEIRRLIAECPFDCIVGNGYAAILPYFLEQWGPETKLVHLRRDREACILSLMKNCEMFPEVYGYYTSTEGATMKRMAAFHFGDMTREEWEALPAVAKVGWYYDKTHALIDQYSDLFGESFDMSTEKLNEEPTRRAIARLTTGSDTVAPLRTHLHAHSFDIASVPAEDRGKAMWMLGQVNWELIVNDDAYGVEYFLTKFLEWKTHQLGGNPSPGAEEASAETAATLARMRAVLIAAINEIEVLEKVNLERGG